MASADSDPHGSPAGQATADQGEAVLVRAVAAYRAALGPRLIAGYALGSLAHGGFSPLVSDVDLGLILEDPVRVKDRLTIRTVARSVKTGGSALDQRLSVFWGTPATLQGQSRRGRFPPLDRLDLLDYGRLLTGTDARSAVARPDRTELLVATSLVAAALAWRHEPPPDGEAAALLSQELVPLFVHYLDDHIARLSAVGQHRLADRFRRWRTRLLA